MHYVYILESLKTKDKFYVGITENLDRRMREHSNPRKDQYTYRHAPWKLETYIQDKMISRSYGEILLTNKGILPIAREKFSVVTDNVVTISEQDKDRAMLTPTNNKNV